MQQLSPSDAMFFNMDTPASPMSIAQLWVCDPSSSEQGQFDVNEVRAYLKDRIHSLPSFHRKLVKVPMGLDHPYWAQDGGLDLDEHIKHLALPKPGNWPQLCALASRLSTQAMDYSRPPWEIYIIEGVDALTEAPAGSYGLLLRFHHAFVDGKASVELLSGLMGDTPSYSLSDDHPLFRTRIPSQRELLKHTLPNLWRQSNRAWGATYRGARKGVELARKLRGEFKPEQFKAPKTRFAAKLSPNRVFDSVTWEVDELKRMRILCEGASINDILIAIVAGGLRRYLAHHRELPAQSLISICPVAVRPKNADADSGNHISLMFISIGSDIADPVERLQKIRQRTGRGIPLAREVVSELSDAMDEMIPAYLRNLQSWATSRIDLTSSQSAVNTIITNVPGAAGEAKFIAGAKIIGAHPLGPITDGVGLVHGIISLCGKLTMGVVTDSAIVDDIPFYTQCLRDSMEEYRELAAATEASNKAVEQALPA